MADFLGKYTDAMRDVRMCICMQAHEMHDNFYEKSKTEGEHVASLCRYEQN